MVAVGGPSGNSRAAGNGLSADGGRPVATFHAAPHIHHHVVPSDDELFQVGMSFTIEPMLLSGDTAFTQAADGWTEHVDDASRSDTWDNIRPFDG